MPVTYVLLASRVLASDTGLVTFSAIPQTYTDLLLRCSMRSGNASTFDIPVVGWASNGSETFLNGNGSTAASTRSTSVNLEGGNTEPAQSSTANTFGSLEMYISNYASTTARKATSIFSVGETNATAANMTVAAHLTDVTNAFTYINIFSALSNVKAGSSFYLYGIKNS
jgi:hypothetical protein